MTSGYVDIDGNDLDNVFDPLGSAAPLPYNVRYQVEGVDFSQRYYPLVDGGTTVEVTGFEYHGADLNTIFGKTPIIGPLMVVGGGSWGNFQSTIDSGDYPIYAGAAYDSSVDFAFTDLPPTIEHPSSSGVILGVMIAGATIQPTDWVVTNISGTAAGSIIPDTDFAGIGIVGATPYMSALQATGTGTIQITGSGLSVEVTIDAISGTAVVTAGAITSAGGTSIEYAFKTTTGYGTAPFVLDSTLLAVNLAQQEVIDGSDTTSFSVTATIAAPTNWQVSLDGTTFSSSVICPSAESILPCVLSGDNDFESGTPIVSDTGLDGMTFSAYYIRPIGSAVSGKQITPSYNVPTSEWALMPPKVATITTPAVDISAGLSGLSITVGGNAVTIGGSITTTVLSTTTIAAMNVLLANIPATGTLTTTNAGGTVTVPGGTAGLSMIGTIGAKTSPLTRVYGGNCAGGPYDFSYTGTYGSGSGLAGPILVAVVDETGPPPSSAVVGVDMISGHTVELIGISPPPISGAINYTASSATSY